MIKPSDVLKLIKPEGQYVVYGYDYEGIVWLNEKDKITKEEFENGIKEYEILKAKAEEEAKAKKAAAEAKLAALGLTADDLRVLGL